MIIQLFIKLFFQNLFVYLLSLKVISKVDKTKKNTVNGVWNTFHILVILNLIRLRLVQAQLNSLLVQKFHKSIKWSSNILIFMTEYFKLIAWNRLNIVIVPIRLPMQQENCWTGFPSLSKLLENKYFILIF